AIEDITDEIVVPGADLGRERALARQSADLEDQLRVPVVEHADLRIGGLPIIHITEPTADTDHRLRQLVLGESPARLVHFVDALVAEIAVAVVPEPVPIVVELRPHERLVGSRPTPEIVIDGAGNRRRTSYLADAAARLVAEAARQGDLAQFA